MNGARLIAHVYDALRTRGELSTSDIREIVRLPRQRVRLALHELRRLGLIRRLGTCHYIKGQSSERFWKLERSGRPDGILG